MIAMTDALYQALTWVLTSSAIVLTAGRYVIRLKTVKSFKADDYIHGLALVFLIEYVSTYTVMFPLNYSVEFWVAGFGEQPSESDLKRYFRLELAVSALFWVVIQLFLKTLCYEGLAPWRLGSRLLVLAGFSLDDNQSFMQIIHLLTISYDKW